MKINASFLSLFTLLATNIATNITGESLPDEVLVPGDEEKPQHHQHFHTLGLEPEIEKEDLESFTALHLFSPFFRSSFLDSFFSPFGENMDSTDNIDNAAWHKTESIFTASNDGETSGHLIVSSSSIDDPHGSFTIFGTADAMDAYLFPITEEKVGDNNDYNDIDYHENYDKSENDLLNVKLSSTPFSIFHNYKKHDKPGSDCPMKNAIEKAQQSCQKDFEKFCGDKKFPNHPRKDQSMLPGPHRHHLSFDSIFSKFSTPHGDEKKTILGFGSREADSCLRDHLMDVSLKCNEAIADIDNLKLKFQEKQNEKNDGEEQQQNIFSPFFGSFIQGVSSSEPPHLRNNREQYHQNQMILQSSPPNNKDVYVNTNDEDEFQYRPSSGYYYQGEPRPIFPVIMLWLFLIFISTRLYFLHRYSKHAVQMAPFINALKENRNIQQMLEEQVGDSFPDPPKQTACFKFMLCLSNFVSYVIIGVFVCMIISKIVIMSIKTDVDEKTGVTQTTINLAPLITILIVSLLCIGISRLCREIKKSKSKEENKEEFSENSKDTSQYTATVTDQSLYEPLLSEEDNTSTGKHNRNFNENPLAATVSASAPDQHS